MNNPFVTIFLLIFSNVFMTLAWYLHLKFESWKLTSSKGLIGIIVIAWGIAFFEYCLQVPANKFGFIENGGKFSLFQLKIIQEVLSLTVFSVFALIFFRNERFTFYHFLSFICLVMAVYFAFKK